MLRQLQIHRQIIQDISVSMLAPLPSLYQRLFRLASLRDDSTGKYADARFAEIYPEAAVHESLAGCHEEILERPAILRRLLGPNVKLVAPRHAEADTRQGRLR